MIKSFKKMFSILVTICLLSGIIAIFLTTSSLPLHAAPRCSMGICECECENGVDCESHFILTGFNMVYVECRCTDGSEMCGGLMELPN